MPIERAFVVHGAGGWDEPTPIGPFTLFDVRPGQVAASVRDAGGLRLSQCSAADLAGGDADAQRPGAAAVLEGEDRGAHRDCLLLGTALALEVAGEVARAARGHRARRGGHRQRRGAAAARSAGAVGAAGAA